MARRVVVAGGSGFVGQPLCQYLVTLGYEVVVLTRRVRERDVGLESVRQVVWDGRTAGPWCDEVEGCFAVVNLVGENVAARRWSRRQKERIVASRVSACAAMVMAVERATQKPGVVVQASAIGYYGDCGDDVIDESGEKGDGFLADVVEQWEAAIEGVGVRLVKLRLGVVLGDGGGMMRQVVTPFRFFVGGHLGNGRQWMSWVHLEDVLGVIGFCLEQESMAGVVNLVAPETVRAYEFFATLGQVLGRPSWLHVPGFVLRVLLGDMAQEMLLSGQRVEPRRLVASGYDFKYGRLSEALGKVIAGPK